MLVKCNYAFVDYVYEYDLRMAWWVETCGLSGGWKPAAHLGFANDVVIGNPRFI